MLNHILDVVGQLGYGAYLIIAVVVFLECAAFIGFLVPGETAAIFGGFLASQGVLDLWIVGLVVSAAAIGGNLMGYEFGRRLRRPWILRHGNRFGLRAEHLRRVDRFFARHGGKTVLLGRMSPFLRALVPFVAGASHLRYRQFVAYSVLGGLLWSAASVAAGYLAGESWRLVAHWIGRMGAVVVGVVVVGAVLVWLWRRRRRNL
jgi:membrane protein DedA with SNARE-associated domain